MLPFLLHTRKANVTRTSIATDEQYTDLLCPLMSANTICLLLLFFTRISTMSDSASYKKEQQSTNKYDGGGMGF